MENFRIDFTLSNPFPDGKKLGECGEKNAAQLIITPPESLASRDEIRLYVVAFSTEKGPVRFGPFPKSETITVPVGRALTVGTALSVQLEGYDEDGEFIIKSSVLSGIMISNSISESGCDGSDTEEGVVPGHFHKNLEILDSFSDENGSLCYNGTKVVSEGNVRTLILKNSDGSFFAFFDSPLTNTFSLVALKDSNGKPYIPDGSVIVGAELNISSSQNPEWVDLCDMYGEDPSAPYFINMGKTRYSEFYGGTPIAVVNFTDVKNKFYDAISNYCLYGIRVRFIEGSGEKS